MLLQCAAYVVHLIRTSTSRSKATLIRASALVPLGLESFEEDGTKLWQSPNAAMGPVVKARIINLRWDAILSRGSVIA